MSDELLTFDDAKAAAEACGAAIFELLDAARRERGAARLAVSGGSTPRIMFEWMAQQGFNWRGVDLFWVDERCVPIDDAQSNFRMTRESLLDTIRLEPGQIHRVETEFPPEEAAVRYVADLTRSFGLQNGELPSFDVLQRGMGPDTHTASLFPGEPLIEDHARTAAAVWVEKFQQHRVTLLPGVLESARHTLCLVTGADKAEPLVTVLRGPRDPLHVPSQISSPQMSWYLDRRAAAKL
ncbi:MAG: 6-phosphogluconolactonase [Acidobacteriota bacterium]